MVCVLLYIRDDVGIKYIFKREVPYTIWTVGFESRRRYRWRLKSQRSLNWKIKTNDGCSRLSFFSLDPSIDNLAVCFHFTSTHKLARNVSFFSLYCKLSNLLWCWMHVPFKLLFPLGITNGYGLRKIMFDGMSWQWKYIWSSLRHSQVKYWFWIS